MIIWAISAFSIFRYQYPGNITGTTHTLTTGACPTPEQAPALLAHTPFSFCTVVKACFRAQSQQKLAFTAVQTDSAHRQ